MELNSQLKFLICNLPEVYQPIYNFPQFDNISTRSCYDRWLLVKAVSERLRNQLNRPLRILDMGCAQGFFCFNLAALGDEVYGVDKVSKNIEFCTELANTLALKASFINADCMEILDQLPVDQFDLVLGFSVLHHVCAKLGLEKTLEYIKHLGQKSLICLFELALKTEPPRWFSVLPENHLKFVDDFAYFRKLSEHATHLSDIKRPLLFCSNYYWYVEERLETFDSSINISHSFNTKIFSRDSSYAPEIIIENLLEKLVDLEEKNSYNKHLPIGSVFISENGSQLIDFGIVQNPAVKFASQKNIYLAFLVAIYEIASRKKLIVRDFIPHFLKKDSYPARDCYQNLITGMLLTPPQKWSFSLMLGFFRNQTVAKINSVKKVNELNNWLQEVEDLIIKRRIRLKYFEPLLLRKLKQELSNDAVHEKLINFVFIKLFARFGKISRFLNLSHSP